MGLPHELLQFAENLYRRFPEEFVALGAPGLEQVYDLRSNGSRTRRISETPAEKTVEITLRRWQAPQIPPLHPSYGCGQAPQMPPFHPSYGCGHEVAAPPPFMAHASSAWSQNPSAGAGFSMRPQQQLTPPPPPQHQQSAGPSAAEAHMASQLNRLESALSAMMPQIEAAVLNQTQTNRHKHSGDQEGDATPLSGTPSSPLRERRRVGALHITPDSAFRPMLAKAEEVKVVAAPVVIESSVTDRIAPRTVKLIAPQEGSSAGPASPNGPTTDKKEKPRITAVRMAPNATDPESPRSPGRYSAWK